MPENILNLIKNKNFSYSELNEKWNQVKNKKDSPDRAFLVGIFGFDNGTAPVSETIFKSIASGDSDNKTISAQDIEKFSQNDKIGTTSVEDFEKIYREKFGDEFTISKFELEKQGINPYFKFDKATDKYKDKKQIEADYKTMLKQTKSDLEKYVKEHPEDTQASTFLKEFKCVNISLACDASDEAQGHFYHKKDKNDIVINYFNYDKTEREEFNKTLFHEMGHSVETRQDIINSKREERDIEDAAMTMTKKLYGNDCFKDLNKEKYLNDFEKAGAYKHLPDYSNGHGL